MNAGKGPTSVQEFNFAQENPEYATFLKTRKSGQNIDIDINDGSEEFGSGVSDRYAKAAEASDAAFNTMATLDNMSSILDTGINTGGGQETLLSFKQLVQTLDPDLVDSEQLANTESFQSASLSEQRKIDESAFITNWVRTNAKLVKEDAFIAELDLNDALREYRRSPAVRIPGEQLNARRKEIVRQQKLIDKGELTSISLGAAPFTE